MTISQRKPTAVTRMFRAAVWLGLPGLAQSANATTATEHMLNPAGPAAAQIAVVWWEMLVVYGAVFIITMVFLVLALASRRKESIFGIKFVVVAGIVIPAVILIFMLLSTIHTTVELGRQEADFRVKITSHHWWFEVRYPDHGIVDANEIHIPVGKVVQFILQSHAVVHSFWVPRLGGKRDMLAGPSRSSCGFKIRPPGFTWDLHGVLCRPSRADGFSLYRPRSRGFRALARHEKPHAGNPDRSATFARS
jgi:heme/copper-type cytochrome/quinol oxidase subunit 2